MVLVAGSTLGTRTAVMKGTDMNYFGPNTNPLLVTIFLIVWIAVGVLQLLSQLTSF